MLLWRESGSLCAALMMLLCTSPCAQGLRACALGFLSCAPCREQLSVSALCGSLAGPAVLELHTGPVGSGTVEWAQQSQSKTREISPFDFSSWWTNVALCFEAQLVWLREIVSSSSCAFHQGCLFL